MDAIDSSRRRTPRSNVASRERNETNEPDDDRTPVLTRAARAPIERSHPRVASRANAIARVEPDERAVKKRLHSIHRSIHRVHPAARPRNRPPRVRPRTRDARISRASSRRFHSFARVSFRFDCVSTRTARGCFFGANDDVRRAARHRRAVLASGRRHRRRRRGSAAERRRHRHRPALSCDATHANRSA